MGVGETLRQAREEIGLSEKEAAENIQAPVSFIHAIERDDFSNLPAMIYARGFLKKYADRLGLDTKEILIEFDYCRTADRPDDKELSKKKAWPVPLARFLNQQKITLGFFLATLLAIGIYFAYELRFVFFGPKLVIESPYGDTVTGQTSIAVLGEVEKEASLVLNGRPLYVNEKGEFKDSALLLPGLNTLEFEARNRLGKTNKVIRYILVK